MDHRISVTAESIDSTRLAEMLGRIASTRVEIRRRQDKLAMDPGTVSIIVAGFGSVNAMIAALASIFVSTHSNRATGQTRPTQAGVIYLETDSDEVQVTIDQDGYPGQVSGVLPEALADVTRIHIAMSTS